MHDQTSYPAQLLFRDADGRRYTADAIPVGELPDLERDIGACCRFHGPPRYMVDGIERPDFDPTIPADLLNSGWYWNGGFLVQHDVPPPTGVGIVIGMPRANLDDIWSQARKLDKAKAEYQAGVAADTAKKAQKPTKTPTQERARPRVTMQNTTTTEQLTLPGLL